MNSKKYNKKHPLWSVYDFQRQIIKRGGEIDRNSDLLAYFERKSLIPEQEPMNIFLWLIKKNKYVIKNKTGLFDTQLIYYTKGRFGWVLQKDYSNFDKNSANNKTHLGDDEFNQKSYYLEDNEIIIQENNNDFLVQLPKKYIDILRLIKNGYNPKTIEMKNNKNLIPAIIIAAGLIISAFIYAFANRYEVNNYLRIDKWTGTMQRMEIKK
ncbi:MAG: hypothetical protein PHD33_06460 [Atribacterota bacterium]|nr:hypothetical protein [Atribacterota bacterium]